MPDLAHIADRPRAYLASTGIPQLMSVLIFSFQGAFAIVQSQLMQRPQYRDYGLVVQYAGLCCTLAVILGVTAIKRRIVFPIGGYVQIPSRNRQIAFVFGTAFGALAIFLIATHRPEIRLSLDSRLFAPFFAITFAAICLGSLWKVYHRATLAFGLYLLCLAPVLWWLPGNSYERMSSLSLAAGPPLAVTGALRLRRFLKSNPADTADATETRDE